MWPFKSASKESSTGLDSLREYVDREIALKALEATSNKEITTAPITVDFLLIEVQFQSARQVAEDLILVRREIVNAGGVVWGSISTFAFAIFACEELGIPRSAAGDMSIVAERLLKGAGGRLRIAKGTHEGFLLRGAQKQLINLPVFERSSDAFARLAKMDFGAVADFED